MGNNILSTKHLCSGCGACSGICSHITMNEDDFGFLRPKIDSSCSNCGRCIKICPMLISKIARDDNQRDAFEREGCLYRNETGYYLKCYEGFIKKNRDRSASGGLCSELLIRLLISKRIDTVYCVGPTGNGDTLFEFQPIHTSDEVLNHARSAYYPISIDLAIDEIKKLEGKATIVCLPCQATAIRTLMKKDSTLCNKIPFIVGLVCGGVPGKGMIEYIAKKKGIKQREIARVTFREKDEGVQCNNCQIKLYNKNQELLGVSRYHGEDYGFVYFSKLFQNEACFCCDDVFAESADVVFGDGWFDEYKRNEYGTSICIVRNREIESYLDQILQTEEIHETTIDRMIVAQKNVYLIQQKKEIAPIYQKVYATVGYYLPDIPNLKKTIKQYGKVWMKYMFDRRKKRIWTKYKKGRRSFLSVDKKLHKVIGLEKRIHL